MGRGPGRAKVFFPGGEFWAEMATIWKEGADTGTGRDRMVLWKDVGWRVFKEAPIFGVGTHNVGVVASEIIPPGALEGRYANPGTLYNRTLHNDFITILAEQGIAGFGVWLSMLISFFLCLRRLRRPAAREAWSRARETLMMLSRSDEHQQTELRDAGKPDDRSDYEKADVPAERCAFELVLRLMSRDDDEQVEADNQKFGRSGNARPSVSLSQLRDDRPRPPVALRARGADLDGVSRV